MLFTKTLSRLCLLLLTGILLMPLLQAQTDDAEAVMELCYETTETRWKSFAETPQLEELPIWDVVNLPEKELREEVHHYFDAQGNMIKDKNYISNTNMFPKWFLPPSTIRSNHEGKLAIFNNHRDYLPGGWAGGYLGTGDSTGYKIDPQTGDRYRLYPHTESSMENYLYSKQEAEDYGFLGRYEFTAPSPADLDSLRALEVTVTESGSVIVVEDTEMKMLWDTAEKVFVIQMMEEGSVSGTTRRTYAYNAEFETDLLSESIYSYPGKLSTGDCFEYMHLTTYSGYGESCEVGEPELRNYVMNSKEELKVLPNPTEDELRVIHPKSETTQRHFELKINDVGGNLIMEKRVNAEQDHSIINVSRFPRGVYILTIQDGKTRYSTKFIKQ